VKNLFGVCLWILFYSVCNAQPTGNLSGRISAPADTLEMATVSLLKTSLVTYTNKQGEFELKNIPVGKYQVRIAYVGYENFQTEVTIENSKNTLLNTEMIPLAAKLNEIVVTGSFKEVSKLESVTPVDVFTSKYFLRNSSTNVWEALNHVNGIFADVDNGVSNTTDIQINGLEGNYSMILIDGVPAMNGLAGMYALNTLPLSMIDKVEIVKGASSTLYGSEAIAGVINIKTKSAGSSPRLAVNVSLNSMLNANIDLTAAVHLKKVSALFSASGESANYRWDLNSDNFMDVPLVNRANFFNKWTIIQADNRTANFYLRGLFEDRLGGQINLPERLTGSDQFYSEWVRTYQWQSGFQYQLPVKEKIFLQADYSEHYQSAYYGTNYFSGKQRTIFSQFTWNKKPDKINDLLGGVSYRLKYYSDNTVLSSDSITGTGKLLHIAGAFFEDEIALTQNHKLLLGIRVDYSSQAGVIPTPRVNYKWNTTNGKNVLRIVAGTGYRVPNLLNEGFGAINGSRKIVVAEKLRTEYAIHTNANYTRIQQLTGGLLNIDASVFYTYFLNHINPDYETDSTLIIYRNNSHGAMSAGFSIYTDFTFNYPLKVGVGFTYTNTFEINKNADGTSEHETPLHSPPFVANFYLSYNFPVPQLSLDWTGNLVSPMLLATVPNDYRPSHSPWYTIQNIQITKKFNNGLQLYAGLKNFFNFIQKDPILRSDDPFNRNVNNNNPFGYRFDTTYGFTTTEGIKGFMGLRYILQ
jgi:outer membrane receptor for ferrienterochelin and colicins